MQRTRQSRRARLDETNNARHFCTVLFFFFLKAAASLLWMHNPPPWGTTTQEAWGWANRFGVGESVFVNNPPVVELIKKFLNIH